ncbi:MAG: S8 family serine peptidase, partial [Lachnospiraceae bacterium]|nr:S8 family serine peptidase [Lachnospiraceae bacterium]
MARVIVRYHGSLREAMSDFMDSTVVELFHQYAIVTLPEQALSDLAALPEVEYIEPPETLFFDLQNGRNISCINQVQAEPGQGGMGSVPDSQSENLSGAGVLVAVLDSGIDYAHPGFRNEDGTTRIRYLWDQTVPEERAQGRMPAGYDVGAEYTAEDIDEALAAPIGERSRIVPTTDSRTGHGTAVAGIAAGNGRGSTGMRYRGIATESELLIVKLGNSGDGFSRTTEVMMGLDYVLHKALELQMPVSINMSFGNNYGPHNGESLFENFITELNGVWKNVIVIATGNEGDRRHHAVADLRQQQVEEIQFAVAGGELGFTVQIWKQYVDQIQISVVSPSGQRYRVPDVPGGSMDGTVQLYYGEPSPYRLIQEVYIRLNSRNNGSVEPGVWTIVMEPVVIRDGRVELWMSGSEVVGSSTGFVRPAVETTMTIPSTTYKVISVGAYDAATNAVASFSGRGRTADGRLGIDLVAPGVDVYCPTPGGGYTYHTGTSMAAPFVAGSAALMMEWGIVRGNDPYLYGEKVKAYLMNGARRLPGQLQLPDITAGWGALCLR